jgi:hypothetical protein
MKNISRFISLLLAAIVLTAPLALAWGGTEGYNPSLKYEGKYTVDVLYYRNRNNPNWYRGLNGTYPDGLLCKDALRHFSTDGRWKGYLRRDGSCGPKDEPAEWSLGNRLNYDDSLKGVR